MNKIIFTLVLGAVFTFYDKKVSAQNFFGLSTGGTVAKLFETKVVRSNFQSKYPFRTGHLFSLNYERNKENKKFGYGLSISYGQQNLEFDFIESDKFGAYTRHYEYKTKDILMDCNFSYNVIPDKESSLKLFLGPSIFKRIHEETIFANGSYPYPTTIYDSTGQQIVVFVLKFWEKENYKSNELSVMNFGLNFGVKSTLLIRQNVFLSLENRNFLFFNDQSLKETINILGLLRCSLLIGLGIKF